MIDTKALRSKVLDLAIQGKLTQQLENEDTEYQDIIILGEQPIRIPKNWKWTNIQSIIKKDVGGGTPSKAKKEYWNNGNIPWMSVKDFSSAKNGLLSDTTDHITEIGLNNSSSNLVDENAIIICMRMALGKIVKISRPMAINQDLRAIWLKDFIDNNYFFYFYSTLKVEGHGMTVAGISKKQLMEYPFPLPPLAEQKRIVEKVESIFRLLDIIDEAQKKYSADAEILKSKLISMGIQGKLTQQLDSDGTAQELFEQIQQEKQKLIKDGKIKKEKPLPPVSEEEIPFEIPDSWMWCRLIEIYNFIDYRGATPNKISEGVPFVTAKNVRKGYLDYSIKEYISEEDYCKRQSRGISHKGDLLFTTEAPMGYAAIADLDKFSAGQRLITLQQYTKDTLIENLYYMFLILSDNFKKQLDEKCSGTTVKGIKADRLKQFLIPLPPLAEQKRIAQVLDECLSIFNS